MPSEPLPDVDGNSSDITGAGMSRLPTDVDMPFAGAAAAIAIEAGALVRGFYENEGRDRIQGRSRPGDRGRSGQRTADRGTPRAASSRACGVYGEEGSRGQMESEYRWYIDPVDGTTNFAHGYPVFCISMGLEHRPAGLAADEDGEIVAGVVYDPTRDELFVAEKGKGAYLNGRRIQVSRAAILNESLLATGFPSRKRHQNPNIHFYQEITLRSHGVRRAGSAALDLAYTACGRFDGYWEFNLNPWDTSARLSAGDRGGWKL